MPLASARRDAEAGARPRPDRPDRLDRDATGPRAAAGRPLSSAARLRHAAIALACAVAGLALCARYPLGPATAALVFAAAALAFHRWDGLWLAALPALLPLIGLAPWTGWISVEEFDLLVLAAAAAGHARLAGRRLWATMPSGAASSGAASRPSALPVWVDLLLLSFAFSVGIAAWRGVADAGGFALSFFDNYHGAVNSLRLAKSFFLVLLLLAPARHLAARDGALASRRLGLGAAIGLAGASLAALWERLVFTGLLDFSSDYRTTALFWEMHVGGAAFDGFLALAVPFVLCGLLAARTLRGWLALTAVAVLAAYACLTTFSRGVYLAVPIGLALTLGLQRWQGGDGHVAPAGAAGRGGLARHGVVVAVFVAATSWLFPVAGYRGALALWAAFALAPLVAHAARGQTLPRRLLGAAGGALLSALAVAAALGVPKGAYLAFAAGGVSTVAALLAHARSRRPLEPRGDAAGAAALLALAGYGLLVTGGCLVAWHWGGEPALQRVAPLLAGAWLAVLVAASVGRGAALTHRVRRDGLAALAMLCAVVAIGVFHGGAYMGDRFATGQTDLTQRRDHWRQGLDLLATPADRWLGKGLGRYPASLFYAGPVAERTGDFSFVGDLGDVPSTADLGDVPPTADAGDVRSSADPGGGTHLRLSAGRHAVNWGEWLRVSQRIALPEPPLRVRMRVRAAAPLRLHAEVCEKHLLYNAACVMREIGVAPQAGAVSAGAWQQIDAPLADGGWPPRPWYAPRLRMFSVAVDTQAGVVDIDNLQLFDASGRDLLANGDFSAGGARWFFSSDRHHLPWHIKNMFLNVTFDQGRLGLALLGTMLAVAFWRLTFGGARRHTLAPAAAGALLGFLVVGLFDSLLDVPRVAFLFYALLSFALIARPARPARPSRVALNAPTSPAPARRLSGSATGLTLLCAAALAWPHGAWAQTEPRGAVTAAAPTARPPLRVGPSRALTTVAEAARAAVDGDTVEVDAGEYRADVAVWTQNDVTVRAVGGRARLIAAGADAEGKGTWVVRGGRFRVEGFDFVGSAVPGRNGAGIRFESGTLSVYDCVFLNNENGILTGNGAEMALEIEGSEFGHNGHGDGLSHNLYVGSIGRLTVVGSYFHHARIGHLLKSRAAFNRIAFNRLTDEAGGTASYELEFPVGGVALVIGNLIEQGPQTDNPVMVSYGIEGYQHPVNELVLAQNTLVDHRQPAGVFLRVAPGAGAVRAVNNVFAGAGDLSAAGPGSFEGNTMMTTAAFDRAVDAEFHWTRRPGGLLAAIDAGAAHGAPLRPASEYFHPRRLVSLAPQRVLTVGALQPALALPAR